MLTTHTIRVARIQVPTSLIARPLGSTRLMRKP
jgi:hypothetical protein